LSHLNNVSKLLTQERANAGVERAWYEESLQVSQQNTAQLQALLNRDPFVLVLIDGADLVFRNNLLRDGDVGGRRAAAALHHAINEYVFSTVDDLPPETKVCVRIYADLEDLSRLFVQNGITSSPKFASFTRGFIQYKALFDIVNVYSQGRESIIDKVEGMRDSTLSLFRIMLTHRTAQFTQHLWDLHCRHIILGCSDGGIYAPILQKIAQDEDFHSRISLLSGVPLRGGLLHLPFQSTRIPDVFRNTRIEQHKDLDYIQSLEPMPLNVLPSVIGTPLGVLTPPLSTPTLSVRSDSRQEKAHSGTTLAEKTHLRTNSVASSANSGSENTTTPKPMTWASVSKKSAALPVTVSSKLLLKASPLPGIRRNKLGQRLDPSPPEYKKDEVSRVKKLKLCNPHYLQGGCFQRDAKCTHEHDYKCTKSELETLKLVARMSCCVHGSACSDVKCIYGHNCPFPVAQEGSMRGKGCLNGETCRFPPHMHGMDMIPVRYVKAT